MTPQDFIDRVQEFDITAAGSRVVLDNGMHIIDAQTNQWYEEGIGGDEKPLRSPYSNTYGYREKKLEMRGKEITDLKFSGEFYDSLAIEVGEESYKIFSMGASVDYDEVLTEWNYGNDIYGLTEKNQEDLRMNYLNAGMANEFNTWLAT